MANLSLLSENVDDGGYGCFVAGRHRRHRGCRRLPLMSPLDFGAETATAPKTTAAADGPSWTRKKEVHVQSRYGCRCRR